MILSLLQSFYHLIKWLHVIQEIDDKSYDKNVDTYNTIFLKTMF